VMRPRLPLIRSSDPITEASTSDRGWIRECFPDLRSHFVNFGSCSRVTTLAALGDLLTCGLALSLLVPRILTNHHHATVPANHLALVTDPLDARLDFHRASF
jgi:hypothetical protein